MTCRIRHDVLYGSTAERHERQVDPDQQPEILALDDIAPAHLTSPTGPMPVMTRRCALTRQVVSPLLFGRPVAHHDQHDRYDDDRDEYAAAPPDHAPADQGQERADDLRQHDARQADPERTQSEGQAAAADEPARDERVGHHGRAEREGGSSEHAVEHQQLPGGGDRSHAERKRAPCREARRRATCAPGIYPQARRRRVRRWRQPCP